MENENAQKILSGREQLVLWSWNSSSLWGEGCASHFPGLGSESLREIQRASESLPKGS